jgi:hypothetical protein
MTMKVYACVAATWLLTTLPALACRGDKILFSDDFKQVDSSWGFDNPDVSVEEGKVKVKPQPDISNLLIYKAILFEDADMCLTVRTPNALSDKDNTMAGPLFWAVDYDNYYMFMITPSGYAEITRKVKGKWFDVIEWRQDPHIKQDPGSKNVLEVATKGDTITAFINGAKFASVKGQAPEGGGQIGMRAQSEKDQVDTWKFTALKVTTVPADVAGEPTSAAASASPPPAATLTPAQPPAVAAPASPTTPPTAPAQPDTAPK